MKGADSVRPAEPGDEEAYEERYYWLRRRWHPAIAAILAHERSGGGGVGEARWNWS